MLARLHDKMSLVGGPFGSRVLPVSSRESRNLDESWTQFHSTDAVAGMPMNASVFYSFAKNPTGSTGTVIIDDTDDLVRGGAFCDVQSDQIPLEHLSNNFQNGGDAWSTPLISATSYSISPPLESFGDEKDLDLEVPELAVDPRWFADTVDRRSRPTLVSTIPVPSPNLDFYDGSQKATELEHGPGSPSLPEDVLGRFDTWYSASSFAERQVKEEESPNMEWDHSPTEDSPLDTSKSLSTESISNSSRNSLELSPIGLPSICEGVPATTRPNKVRPARLVFQSVTRRRKQKNAATVVEQIHQPKPLQIVQEDGQGGAIASEDFVSPPRGARRKGPLSTVGRANAGLRRKNRDTCVQCRLNKRKVREMPTISY
jgi:hypothetical protein